MNVLSISVGMKPLSERDENRAPRNKPNVSLLGIVGMKPLSERDENQTAVLFENNSLNSGRNEATL